MNPTAKPDRDIDRQNKDAVPKSGADKSMPSKPVSSQPGSCPTAGKSGGDSCTESPAPNLHRTDSTAASAGKTNLPEAERYNDEDTDADKADDKADKTDACATIAQKSAVKGTSAHVNKSTPVNGSWNTTPAQPPHAGKL